MSGAQDTHAENSFLRIEGGRGLKGIFGEGHLHFGRLNAARDQHVEREVVRGRVLSQHHRFAAQVGGGLDVLAHHDAVAAVREIDLLVNARHDPAVDRVAFGVDKALKKQRHHIERGPADVDLAGGVRVTHGNRVVDQHEIDLEFLSARSRPFLPRLEPVVRKHDRCPACPYVQSESDRVVDERLVGSHPLDRRQLLGGLEAVFLDGRRARRILA